MSVKLRLRRMGKKKQAFYRIVAIDSRAARNGRYIENLGTYNPRKDPAEVNLKQDRALYWLQQGAIPSDTVRSFLKRQGILLKWHLQRNGADDAAIAEALQNWEVQQMERQKKKEALAEQQKRAKKTKKAEEKEEPVEVAAAEEAEATTQAPAAEEAETETSEKQDVAEPAAEAEVTAKAEESAPSEEAPEPAEETAVAVEAPPAEAEAATSEQEADAAETAAPEAAEAAETSTAPEAGAEESKTEKAS